jgi:CheY-like chemotaxis protein
LLPKMSAICVLLVEDDLVTRRIVAKYLASCFYDVIEAVNGRVALDILEGPQGEAVDIILTDNVMPEVTGLELMVKLVQEKRWQHLPVIIMSSEMREDVVQQAMAAGACGFLHKPVKRTEIISLWKHAWKGGRRRKGEAQEWTGGVATPSQTKASNSAIESLFQQAAGADQSGKVVGAEQCKGEGIMARLTAAAYSEAVLSVQQYEPCMSSPMLPTSSAIWPPPSMCTTASILGACSQPLPGQLLEIEPLDLEKASSIASSAGTALRCLLPTTTQEGSCEEQREAQPRSMPPIFGTKAASVPQPNHQMLFQAFQAAAAQQQHSREAAAANRRAAIARFRAKRTARCFGKRVRYVNRKRLAERRPRVRGQFCKAPLDAVEEGSFTEA